MRSQKSEIESLQFQLSQVAHKIRSSVERELRETIQAVTDERDRFRDQSSSLERDVTDLSQQLAAMSEDLRRGKEELRLAYGETEELQLELSKKTSLISEEADKVTVLERQLDTKSHHCNDLEREINHMRRKTEEQARLKKVIATQTSPDFYFAEQENRIVCLEDKLAVTEQRAKDALDQLARTVKERDALRGQLNDVTENSSAMQLQLNKNSATVSNLELSLKQSTDEISRLETVVLEKEKRNREIECAADEVKNMVSSLTAENEALKQRVKQQSDDEKLSSLVFDLEQKNSELTSQVCSLTEQLQMKQRREEEVLLQKDKSSAQLKLQPNEACQSDEQQHGDEAKLVDGPKKQYETELRDSGSESAILQALEISHQQEVLELKEKVSDLTSKLSLAEQRACQLEQQSLCSSGKTAGNDVETSSSEPFNILSLIQTPIDSGQSRDAASVSEMLPGSCTLSAASDSQLLVTTLQSRISELEMELEKSKSEKATAGDDGKLVSVL